MMAGSARKDSPLAFLMALPPAHYTHYKAALVALAAGPSEWARNRPPTAEALQLSVSAHSGEPLAGVCHSFRRRPRLPGWTDRNEDTIWFAA